VAGCCEWCRKIHDGFLDNSTVHLASQKTLFHGVSQSVSQFIRHQTTLQTPSSLRQSDNAERSKFKLTCQPEGCEVNSPLTVTSPGVNMGRACRETNQLLSAIVICLHFLRNTLKHSSEVSKMLALIRITIPERKYRLLVF
jgi:hypothetical protein